MRFLDRMFPLPLNRSLRVKVTVIVILPLIIILGTLSTIEYARHRSILLKNLATLASYSGQLIEDSLRHSMLASNFEDVQNTLDIVGKNENFRVVYLLDSSGQVIFAPNRMGVGTHLDNRSSTCLPCHDQAVEERPKGVVITLDDGQRVFRSMHPIENSPECAGCHDPRERLIGLLLTDISVGPFETALAADLRANLLWWGSTILVTALIVNLAMRHLVIHRLEKVANALEDFGSGKRDLRLTSGSSDEIGQIEKDFNEMGQRIQVEEAENLALSKDLQHQTAQQHELLKRLITAQEDERKRVARELHDELGQALSGLALHSGVMEQFIDSDPNRAHQHLSLTRDLIARTTQQMYELILALRPSVLDDLGLSAALRSHLERVLTGSGIKYQLDSSGMNKRLPPAIETALYRIFQEALSNIVKHSGADEVKITLAKRDGVFEGEIVDNGRGFNQEDTKQEVNNPHGLGLLGMQERVAQCNGTVEITSRPGEGTRIRVFIPLSEGCYE